MNNCNNFNLLLFCFLQPEELVDSYVLLCQFCEAAQTESLLPGCLYGCSHQSKVKYENSSRIILLHIIIFIFARVVKTVLLLVFAHVIKQLTVFWFVCCVNRLIDAVHLASQATDNDESGIQPIPPLVLSHYRPVPLVLSRYRPVINQFHH